MRVLVTGASGLLGGGVARALAARGEEVTVFQRRPLADSGTAGLRESLNCSFAALCLAIVATLLATAGNFRLRRQTLAPASAPSR